MSRVNNPQNEPGQDDGKRQAASAAGQLRDTASQVAGNIRDMGGQVRDAAYEKYENLRDTATNYYEHGREKARHWTHQVEEYVQEQPVKTLLIAAGVGMLLGILWKR